MSCTTRATSGRSAVAASLAIAALIGACDGASAPLSVTAEPAPSEPEAVGWKKVEVEGKFSVELPGEPKVERDTKPSERGTVTTTDYVAWRGSDMYSLRHGDDPLYASLPQAAVGGVLEVAMKAKIEQYQSAEGGKLVRAGDVTVGNLNGKEYVVTVEKPLKGTNRGRLFLVAGQYYDLMVFVAADSQHDQHERYFASFKPAPSR